MRCVSEDKQSWCRGREAGSGPDKRCIVDRYLHRCSGSYKALSPRDQTLCWDEYKMFTVVWQTEPNDTNLQIDINGLVFRLSKSWMQWICLGGFPYKLDHSILHSVIKPGVNFHAVSLLVISFLCLIWFWGIFLNVHFTIFGFILLRISLIWSIFFIEQCLLKIKKKSI